MVQSLVSLIGYAALLVRWRFAVAALLPPPFPPRSPDAFSARAFSLHLAFAESRR
jgi:hypothetical protein